jgi:hypothetical protein
MKSISSGNNYVAHELHKLKQKTGHIISACFLNHFVTINILIRGRSVIHGFALASYCILLHAHVALNCHIWAGTTKTCTKSHTVKNIVCYAQQVANVCSYNTPILCVCVCV